MPEGPPKEYINSEIHQIIVKVECGTVVLDNHVPIIKQIDLSHQHIRNNRSAQ